MRNVVIMNAAAGILASNLATDLKGAARLAAEAIDSGQAKEKLEKLVATSQSLG